MPKIIAVEGVDGVGKSTLCERLKEILSGKNIIVTKTPYLECAELTSRAKDDVASFCSYLISDISIKNQLNTYEWIILDRYILSTIVYHHELVDLLKSNAYNILNNVDILKPTATILLEANDLILKNRLGIRKDYSNHKFTSIELKKRFELYMKKKEFKPFLGKLIRSKCENYLDQADIINKILFLLKS